MYRVRAEAARADPVHGSGHQGGRALRTGDTRRRDADTHRKRHVSAVKRQRASREILGQAFAELFGASEGRFRQNQQELVAAVPALHIRGPQHLGQSIADRCQHFIAAEMTVAIVDLLEPVQIQHGDRQGPARTFGSAQLDFEHLQGVLSVHASGQLVANAVVLCVEQQMDVAGHDANDRARRGDEPPFALGERRQSLANGEHARRLVARRQHETLVGLHGHALLRSIFGRARHRYRGEAFHFFERQRTLGRAVVNQGVPFGPPFEHHPHATIAREHRERTRGGVAKPIQIRGARQRLSEHHQCLKLLGPFELLAGCRRDLQ